ncbi:MAG: hypothetical protein J3K34DRAFT_477760 [Monoraphidium minutum]|nr:MAG: hypothetical protein J3K34DRAFT_477760 [Monoraphidium minutum]
MTRARGSRRRSTCTPSTVTWPRRATPARAPRRRAARPPDTRAPPPVGGNATRRRVPRSRGPRTSPPLYTTPRAEPPAPAGGPRRARGARARVRAAPACGGRPERLSRPNPWAPLNCLSSWSCARLPPNLQFTTPDPLPRRARRRGAPTPHAPARAGRAPCARPRSPPPPRLLPPAPPKAGPGAGGGAVAARRQRRPSLRAASPQRPCTRGALDSPPLPAPVLSRALITRAPRRPARVSISQRRHAMSYRQPAGRCESTPGYSRPYRCTANLCALAPPALRATLASAPAPGAPPGAAPRSITAPCSRALL